jgi:hypothetical protein
MTVDERVLHAQAVETARAVVAAHGRGCEDREALIAAIARLVLAHLRCGVEAYLKECRR